MPTLYRPRTDKKRVMALSQAHRAHADLPGSPLSADTVTRLNDLLPRLELEMQERGSALAVQAGLTRLKNPLRKKLRAHIRHFIRVFNMGVKREVFHPADRTQYGLPFKGARLPRLQTDADLVMWGGRIVSGEQARVAAGGTPMAMPSAAEVDAQLTAFKAVHGQHSTSKDTYDREQADVEKLRKDVDELIADIWDEVLFHFRKETPPSLRRKARLYGVTYRPSSKTEVLEEEEDGDET